ncbi:MAG: hypothetical protein KDC98_05470 [Planctomycetes bacterium]|nr:hypothetical protein [Planctomycetota bacterium]
MPHSRGQTFACAVLAVIWAGGLASKSAVPSEDGVSYLWMAERFAAGEWQAALALVFPPGFPLLVAALASCGVAVSAAADIVNVGAFAWTVWPLAWIARRLSPGVPTVDLVTCLLFVTGSLLVRVVIEVYSEPSFLLLMAWGTVAGLCGRFWLVGAVAGLAFWIRPEGLLLASSFLLARPRQAWRTVPGAAAGVALLAVTRWLCGHGADPLPILGFHDTRDDLPERGAILANLLEVWGAWFEAYGPLGALLLPWAVPRWRRALPTAPALWWQIALQVAVVCTFVVRRRFLLSCAIPAFALAGAALLRIPARWRAVVLIGLLAFGMTGTVRGRIDPDRIVERDLGLWIGAWLEPGQRVTGDLTRVIWFAGQQPLPPRHFDTAQLVAMAAPPEVRYFVFSERSRRESSRQIEGALTATFGRVEIPEPVGSRCRERGIVVLARRR